MPCADEDDRWINGVVGGPAYPVGHRTDRSIPTPRAIRSMQAALSDYIEQRLDDGAERTGRWLAGESSFGS